MKCLFCSMVILLLVATPASFGRTAVKQQKEESELLAQGNPPLTLGLVDRLVEFFEWSLASKFTKSQRTVFTTRLIQVWEKRDQSTIDGLVKTAKSYDGVANLKPEERNKAQRELQSIILSGLPDDPLGQLLLSVYKSSHPESAVSTNDQRAPANSPGEVTRVPPEIVGEWIARRGSGSGYYNPNTGQSSGPNATIDSYKIFANGTFEHSILMQSSLYNCTTTIVGRETGPIAINGSTFTITPRTGTLDSKNTCSPSLNESKQTNVDPQTLSWRLERGEYGLQLCLQRTDGASACYLKQ